jgi:metacaspase-1
MVKKALIVGINYAGTGNDLQGCINDAHNMEALLESQGFVVETLLEKQATTAGIKAGLQRLTTGVVPGDVIVFHYSGHGSQMPSSVEADGYEEIICPIDLNWTTRVITDDDLRRVFHAVPNGVNTTVILDCCHSGDALDQNDHLISTRTATKASIEGGRYMTPPAGVVEDLADRELVDWNARKDINASALLIAGCRSDQTSADAYINGTYQGAATASILAAFKRDPNITYADLIESMNDYMVDYGYEQRPQLDGFFGLHGEVFLKPFGSADQPAADPVVEPAEEPVEPPAVVVPSNPWYVVVALIAAAAAFVAALFR